MMMGTVGSFGSLKLDCSTRTVPISGVPTACEWIMLLAAPRCARPVALVKVTSPTVMEQRRGSASGEEEME
jgi:hypothetical protein